MKLIKYIFLGILSSTMFSCEETEFLKENPSALFTSDNMYVTKAHFESAVASLYNDYRFTYYNGKQRANFDQHYGTDMMVGFNLSGNRTFGFARDYNFEN